MMTGVHTINVFGFRNLGAADGGVSSKFCGRVDVIVISTTRGLNCTAHNCSCSGQEIHWKYQLHLITVSSIIIPMLYSSRLTECTQ